MILTPHILIGAAIGAHLNSWLWVIILAVISHFLLDIIPHAEYPIKDTPKVIMDFSLGFLLVVALNPGFLVLLGAAFAIFPDFLTLFNIKAVTRLHRKTHFLRKKNFPFWGRVLIQLLVSILALALL